MKSLFEQMGGTYTRIGDYFLPDLKLPEKGNKPIGVWGQRHKRCLKQNHKVIYINLLTSGKLNSYLADIDRQAEDMFLRLVKELSEKENVTETAAVRITPLCRRYFSHHLRRSTNRI